MYIPVCVITVTDSGKEAEQDRSGWIADSRNRITDERIMRRIRIIWRRLMQKLRPTDINIRTAEKNT
jgi:hypothetical protein